jgi:hypothetical protein
MNITEDLAAALSADFEKLLDERKEALSTAAQGRLRKLAAVDVQAAIDILKGLPVTKEEDKAAGEIDAIIREHCGGMAWPAVEQLREMLVTDREGAMEIIAGIKNARPVKKGDLPEPPQHDPYQEDSPEAKARRQKDLIEEIKKEGRFTDYTSAREEARRRNPGIFD